MRALYDLSLKPASFDFWIWLTISRTLGATEVVFDVSKGFSRKKLPQHESKRMYENVLIPSCEIQGIKWSEGSEGDISPLHSHGEAVKNHPLKLHQFELEDGPPTVTIRESIRNKHRNSSQDWRVFAREIGAVVIEDAYCAPLSLKDRVEIYRKSRVNYFCSNGPGAIGKYSNLPTVFYSPKHTRGCWGGFEEGKQFPWFLPTQRIVWEEDTIDSLRKTHAIYS